MFVSAVLNQKYLSYPFIGSSMHPSTYSYIHPRIREKNGKFETDYAEARSHLDLLTDLLRVLGCATDTSVLKIDSYFNFSGSLKVNCLCKHTYILCVRVCVRNIFQKKKQNNWTKNSVFLLPCVFNKKLNGKTNQGMTFPLYIIKKNKKFDDTISNAIK